MARSHLLSRTPLTKLRPLIMEQQRPIDPDAITLAARQRLLTVGECHQMADAGILGEDDPVELLNGRLNVRSSSRPSHLHCVNHLTELFARQLSSTDAPDGDTKRDASGDAA